MGWFSDRSQSYCQVRVYMRVCVVGLLWVADDGYGKVIGKNFEPI